MLKLKIETFFFQLDSTVENTHRYKINTFIGARGI